MLFRSLDEVLGSMTKVRVLRALVPLSSPVSGNEARILAEVSSRSSAVTALEELTALGILLRDDTRRIRFFRINRDHDLAEPLRALFEAESRRMATLRDALKEIVDAGAVQKFTLSTIIFGSNARGDARPTSDLDLLAVTRREPETGRVLEVLIDAVPQIQRRFGLRLSPLVLAKRRVRERYRDGDPLMRNIETEGRTLFGTPFHEIAGAW